MRLMANIEMTTVRKLFLLPLAVAALLAAGCAKQVRLNALPLAGAGTATARVELTYNRNNLIAIKLSKVPLPSSLNNQFTRYVLWVSTPDHSHVINAGQLRVENNKAALRTLTPLRQFLLFITAENSGEVMSPGPDVLFQTKKIDW
jgi:hypothetical protein